MSLANRKRSVLELAKPAAEDSKDFAAGLDEFQGRDLPQFISFLTQFWTDYAANRTADGIGPADFHWDLDEINNEELPQMGQQTEQILASINTTVAPNSVKTSHPMFLAYVTPPALDICALGDAVAAILNQNVSFAELSPVGTAIEQKVINWLGHIVGYGHTGGGVMVSGGSTANLYGLAIARRIILGKATITRGNCAAPRYPRIYCSEHIHRSVHKAAVLLGLGSNSICTIQSNDKHQIDIGELERQIKKDKLRRNVKPIAIIGAAGTRLAGAFDDLKSLSDVARANRLWLHVDAAYGGFLRLASPRPQALEDLQLADSITIDPHKLLFVPFDAGCILVRDRQHLIDTFGVEGEYLEKCDPPGVDFADFSMQLGRSMKSFKVWLALKLIGTRRYGQEFSRLLNLAKYLRERIDQDSDFELLAPVESIVVCFRWKNPSNGKDDLDAINQTIPTWLRREGIAYVNRVSVGDNAGIRVCLSNFRTQRVHIDKLLASIKSYCLSPN